MNHFPRFQDSQLFFSSKSYILGVLMTLLASALVACSSILPANVPPPTVYSFDNSQVTGSTGLQNKLSSAAVKAMSGFAPTLVLSIPHAAAGFDTQQMMYMRQLHQLEHFRENQWVDTPSAMLVPLVVSALEQSGSFGAVIQSPTTVAGQYRLDLEVVRLQQEFFTKPSRVHFTLRAYLSDITTHQVVGWQEFDRSVNATSDDPYGGVIATNQAIRTTLAELASFCTETVNNAALKPQLRPDRR